MSKCSAKLTRLSAWLLHNQLVSEISLHKHYNVYKLCLYYTVSVVMWQASKSFYTPLRNCSIQLFKIVHHKLPTVVLRINDGIHFRICTFWTGWSNAKSRQILWHFAPSVFVFLIYLGLLVSLLLCKLP